MRYSCVHLGFVTCCILNITWNLLSDCECDYITAVSCTRSSAASWICFVVLLADGGDCVRPVAQTSRLKAHLLLKPSESRSTAEELPASVWSKNITAGVRKDTSRRIWCFVFLFFLHFTAALWSATNIYVCIGLEGTIFYLRWIRTIRERSLFKVKHQIWSPAENGSESGKIQTETFIYPLFHSTHPFSPHRKNLPLCWR